MLSVKRARSTAATDFYICPPIVNWTGGPTNEPTFYAQWHAKRPRFEAAQHSLSNRNLSWGHVNPGSESSQEDAIPPIHHMFDISGRVPPPSELTHGDDSDEMDELEQVDEDGLGGTRLLAPPLAPDTNQIETEKRDQLVYDSSSQDTCLDTSWNTDNSGEIQDHRCPFGILGDTPYPERRNLENVFRLDAKFSTFKFPHPDTWSRPSAQRINSRNTAFFKNSPDQRHPCEGLLDSPAFDFMFDMPLHDMSGPTTVSVSPLSISGSSYGDDTDADVDVKIDSDEKAPLDSRTDQTGPEKNERVVYNLYNPSLQNDCISYWHIGDFESYRGRRSPFRMSECTPGSQRTSIGEVTDILPFDYNVLHLNCLRNRLRPITVAQDMSSHFGIECRDWTPYMSRGVMLGDGAYGNVFAMNWINLPRPQEKPPLLVLKVLRKGFLMTIDVKKEMKVDLMAQIWYFD